MKFIISFCSGIEKKIVTDFSDRLLSEMNLTSRLINSNTLINKDCTDLEKQLIGKFQDADNFFECCQARLNNYYAIQEKVLIIYNVSLFWEKLMLRDSSLVVTTEKEDLYNIFYSPSVDLWGEFKKEIGV